MLDTSAIRTQLERQKAALKSLLCGCPSKCCVHFDQPDLQGVVERDQLSFSHTSYRRAHEPLAAYELFGRLFGGDVNQEVAGEVTSLFRPDTSALLAHECPV